MDPAARAVGTTVGGEKVLQWFAGRVEEARDEHGFTLIELLVVITLRVYKWRYPRPRPS